MTSLSASKTQAGFYKSQENFFVKDARASSLGTSAKRIIPLKQLKFPVQKVNNGIPKPPPQFNQKNNPYKTVNAHILSSTEAALKMADEGIASIEKELRNKKSVPKIKLSQGPSRDHSIEHKNDF